MIPQNFNVEEFAQALAGQAAEAFPPELPEQVKQTVTQVVYEFIKIAGNALNGEERTYDENETILICQLVGEWMYHKGIDNYKNQIPQEYWKPILQQIAFAIFESAKAGVTQGKPSNEIVDLAENAVNESYKALIQQLANENKLSKPVEEILSQSNLHDYVEQNYNEENALSSGQEEKDLKLMTMALFFKSIPSEEVTKMVKLLGEKEKQQIIVYMQMPDLEKYVDPVLYNQYLEKFHNFMPKVQRQKRRNSMFSKINDAFAHIEPEEFDKIIAFERKNVKNFLLHVYNGKMYEEDLFSLDLTNTIVDYATQKVYDK